MTFTPTEILLTLTVFGLWTVGCVFAGVYLQRSKEYTQTTGMELFPGVSRPWGSKTLDDEEDLTNEAEQGDVGPAPNRGFTL